MKDYARANAEPLIILSLFAIFGLLKVVAENQIAFLNLYFLPVLAAGYFLGKKRALLSATAGVLMAILFIVRWPDELTVAGSNLYAGLNILVWASLLLLSSILVSTMNESRYNRQAAMTLRLLEKYIRDITERDNHPARVGRLAGKIGRELKLPTSLVVGVETAGYLHDIADSEEGLEIIGECQKIKDDIGGPVIGEAIPILSRRHNRPGRPTGAVGPYILEVADLYDTARTEDKQADLLGIVRRIESETDGKAVVAIRALVRVLHKQSA